MLSFVNDYCEGAHPEILRRLGENNLVKTPGYGEDALCASAKDKIRAAFNCPDAEVYFLVGGTQTNAIVIDSVLAQYQGVVAAASGHINVH
ncbi:MAG: low specificity L-threonine aldolase, partial [Clostridia bacterium]|nr:low specificity L-threonine aldolase [Clostridia bacterium]